MTGAMLLGGFILLGVGAELLVRGAASLAASVGLSPLVIGLTVVAYGTSTPELSVSVLAGLAGQPEIAVANVVGSNIANILLILGLCAVSLPLAVSRQLVRSEVPILIGASLLAWWMLRDCRITRLDGAVLVTLVVFYTAWTIRKSRQETALAAAALPVAPPLPNKPKTGLTALVIQVALMAAGIGLLVLGSNWLVKAAIALAQLLGVSDVVIGLTIVAVGTSLPELATSLAATVRGHRDIAIGNAVGSSIYNLLAILGLAGLATPGGLVVAPSLAHFDVPVMVATAALCLPVFFTGYSISRLEGACFLAGYAAYTTYLVLAATHHAALPEFSRVILWYAFPAAGVLLAGSLAHAVFLRRAQTK